jgi:hypothetical protein
MWKRKKEVLKRMRTFKKISLSLLFTFNCLWLSVSTRECSSSKTENSKESNLQDKNGKSLEESSNDSTKLLSFFQRLEIWAENEETIYNRMKEITSENPLLEHMHSLQE